ncbi:MAG: type I DNA topoisomerase [Candidatus Muirbacterium halophilum]|nr:type I DNA topoisomerase [Candidatus Muirbacterium halophilum]
MGKNLLIVESPGKIKTLNKILGSNFIVKASVGHIRDLPKKDISIKITDKELIPTYRINPDKQKVVEDLKRASKNIDTIYLAPDPDREGEAIAWHLAHILKIKLDAKCRVVFNAITPTEVLKGIENPSFIDINKVNAQQSRRMLDRIVGYKLSPFLWSKVMKGLSAGRVQSVAVLLVVDREKEIEAFIPEEYFIFKADFKVNDITLKETKLFKLNGKKAEKLTINKEKADEYLKEINDNKDNFILKSIKNKEKTVSAPMPFITSTLQQEASRINGFSASHTMSVAQKLYEGKEIKGENYGLITYMRTDSVRVSPEGQQMSKKYIENEFGKEYYLSSKVKEKKGKGKVQDAHEAVRPTYVEKGFEPDSIKKHLTEEEYKIYKLIWNRFLASQMKPAIFDVEDLMISDGKFDFNIKFEKLKFAGYQKIYKSEDDNIDEQEHVTLNEGDKSELLKAEYENKWTKPPARFTESSLIKTLEKEGIGRPSTYASIMKKIMDREYVIRENKNLMPTDLGIIVNYLMVKSFEKFINIKFTAEFESKLDKVEEGVEDYQKVLVEFYKEFEEELKIASHNVSKMAVKTDLKCEKCDAPMVGRISGGNIFLGCSAFPACKFTQSLPNERMLPAAFDDEFVLEIAESIKDFNSVKVNNPDEINVEYADVKCSKCQGEMIVKNGKFGKFLACQNYPQCKNTMPILEKTDMECPEKDCDGFVIERKSKRGKPYYTCSNYPKCKYLSFEKPKKKE